MVPQLIKLRRRHNLDLVLVGLMAMIGALGLMTVYSASAADFKKQAIYFGFGLVAFVVATLFDYRHLRKAAAAAYILMLLLLLAVHVVGHSALGARRWLTIAAFPVEPSEFSKLMILVTLAAFFARLEGHEKKISTFAGALALAAPPLVLILLQPDLGTAMVFGALLVGLLLLAGTSRVHLAAFFGLCFAVLPIVPHILHGYQRKRLEIFLDPTRDPLGAGYNLIQARIAVGSGGFLGHGWLHGPQGSLGFVPERATDFIFAVFAEQFGLVGCVFLLILFGLLVLRLCAAAAAAPDRFGALLIGGVAVMFLFQVAENVGMNVGLTPIAGIPLPMISYGGSSLVTNLAALGLVQSVLLRRRLFVYRQQGTLENYLLNESGTVRLTA